MKRAPAEPKLYGAVGYGYNDLGGGSANQAAFAYGRRFADQRAGLMLAGSWFDTDRKSENFEVAYDDGELDELEYRDYEINRERVGVALNLDFAPADNTDLRLGSTFNQFDDQEYRRRVRNQVGDDRIERQLKDRFESQTIWNVTGSTEHLFADSSRLAARFAYAAADEDEPKGYYTTFRQDDVEFDPNVGPDSVDPDNIQANPLNEDYTQFALDEIADEDNLTTEETLVAALDYDLPFSTDGDVAGLWQFGLKYRDSSKDRDNETFVYETGEDVYLLDLVDTGYDVTSILDGRYPMGPFQSPGAARDLLGRPDLEGEKDHEADAADFQADETVLAAYAAVELYLSDRLLLLPGLRYEQTDADSTGYEVLFDSEGDWASTEPVKGSNDYGLLLPNLQLRYAVDGNTNLRAAVTRTFARPNYADLAPYRLVFEEDAEIELGNPTLDPTSSWNLDLMVERYFATVGVVSAGAFYKSLQDFIYPFRFEEEVGDETYEVTQPRNGDNASLLGLELAYHNQLRRLPAPWSGLGLFANYTYIDSEAAFPGRGDTTVPGQAEHVGNFGVSYELGGFSGLVAVNVHGKYLEEVGGDDAEDVYVDDHVQLDLSAAYRLTGGLQLRLQLNNLTDEPFRRYLADADRPVQEEYYSWGALLSVSYDFF
jgi:TonB-dependent receptor